MAVARVYQAAGCGKSARGVSGSQTHARPAGARAAVRQFKAARCRGKAEARCVWYALVIYGVGEAGEPGECSRRKGGIGQRQVAGVRWQWWR